MRDSQLNDAGGYRPHSLATIDGGHDIMPGKTLEERIRAGVENAFDETFRRDDPESSLGHLATNAAEPENVREVTEDDGTYLIADQVPFVKPMELSGGNYVPEDELRASANEWDGVSVTLNHPRGPGGDPVSVEALNMEDKYGLGEVRNPTWDGEFLRADLAVNVQKANLLGGEAFEVLRALRQGSELEVSSQYIPEPLSAGVYDGEYRENVETIKRPDSVAVLPNGTGVCSRDHGCGFSPSAVAANAKTGDMPGGLESEHSALIEAFVASNQTPFTDEHRGALRSTPEIILRKVAINWAIQVPGVELEANTAEYGTGQISGQDVPSKGDNSPDDFGTGVIN